MENFTRKRPSRVKTLTTEREQNKFKFKVQWSIRENIKCTKFCETIGIDSKWTILIKIQWSVHLKWIGNVNVTLLSIPKRLLNSMQSTVSELHKVSIIIIKLGLLSCRQPEVFVYLFGGNIFYGSINETYDRYLMTPRYYVTLSFSWNK